MSTGIKYDQGKIRYDLVPPECIRELASILTFGAAKYGENSWQNLEDFDKRYYAALMRHLEAWRAGQPDDVESGQPHLSHAFACMAFLLFNHLRIKNGT